MAHRVSAALIGVGTVWLCLGATRPVTLDLREMTVRITRPLIGTAIGAGVLGATLALGVTMASASTSTGTSHSAARTATTSPAASPGATMGRGHKCPGMSGGGHAQHSTQQG